MGLLMGHVGNEDENFGSVHFEKHDNSLLLYVPGEKYVSSRGAGRHPGHYIEFKTELIPVLIQKLIEVYVIHCGGTLPEEIKEQDDIQARLRADSFGGRSPAELIMQMYKDMGRVGEDAGVTQKLLENICRLANMYGEALNFK